MPSIDAIHRQTVRTGKTEGTILVLNATTTTEAPFIAIIYANILGTHRALAVRPDSAGSTEVGHVRYANENQVWSRAGNLVAGPSGRAFVLARRGTDLLAQMLDAPARETIVVGNAWVLKAPFARLTLRQGIGHLFQRPIVQLLVRSKLVGSQLPRRCHINAGRNIRRICNAVCYDIKPDSFTARTTASG